MSSIVVRGETKGKTYEVFLDECDLEWASDFYWYVQPHGRTHYVWYNEWSGERSNRKKKKRAFHRLIMERINGPLGKRRVDHKNGDGLDNRRDNLRFVTHGQNMWNSRRRITKISSQYKGVYERRGMYNVRIAKDGKAMYLGNYATERDAAIVYNLVACEIHGEFASLNSIQYSQEDEDRVRRLMVSVKSRSGKQFSSQYRGVVRKGNYWRAKLAGQRLGRFNTQEEAALAYNKAAIDRYGIKAKVNTILSCV